MTANQIARNKIRRDKNVSTEYSRSIQIKEIDDVIKTLKAGKATVKDDIRKEQILPLPKLREPLDDKKSSDRFHYDAAYINCLREYSLPVSCPTSTISSYKS